MSLYDSSGKYLGVENQNKPVQQSGGLYDLSGKYQGPSEKPSFQQIGQGLLKTQTLPAEMGIGGIKGIGSSLVGLGQLALKGLSSLPLPQKMKSEAQQGIQTGEELKQKYLQPKSTFESLGKTGEQVGEFFIPVGGEERAIQALTKVLPKAPALAAGLTKMAGTGAEFAGKELVQTGGNKQKAIESGLIGAAGPVIEAAIKPVQKFFTEIAPERLYSTIFKTAEDDLRQAYRSISKGQELNPTLAKEALDRGIKGSPQNMAVYSFQKLDQLEKQVQETVKDKSKLITIENKKDFNNLLKEISNKFRNTFFTQRGKEADSLIKEFNQAKGNKVTMDIVLKMRRFIDKMRNTSSYRLDPTLTAKQEEFKGATDYLRKKLSDAGLKNLMNEERFYIQALDNIISSASKRQNRNVIGMLDLLAGGGGIISGGPLGGLTADLAIRGFQNPITITNLAQGLYRLKNIPNAAKLFPAIPPTLINNSMTTNQQETPSQ